MTHAQRLREIRARGQIRRWEYRQRNLAHGAWLRFRTALAHAERAFRVSPERYAELVANGGRIDDRGAGLEPPRHIVWVTPAQAGELTREHELTLRIDADMLAAEQLVLVPFRSPDMTEAALDCGPDFRLTNAASTFACVSLLLSEAQDARFMEELGSGAVTTIGSDTEREESA